MSAATDTIEVQLPDGVVSAKPEYVPGWTLEVETVASEPYDEFGTTKTERVGVIRWSGGDLPDFAFYDFGVRATFLADPGTVLAFPVVQKCGDAEVAWIEPMVEGQPEPEHPAPTVTIGRPRPGGGGLMSRPAATRATSCAGRRSRRLSALQAVLRPLLLLVALLALAPGGVSAHAQLVSLDPPDGAILAASPAAVTLTFNEQIGLATGGLRVLDGAGQRGGPGRGRPGRCRGLAAVAAPRATAGTW